MSDFEFEIEGLELVGIQYELILLKDHLEHIEKQVQLKKEESEEKMDEQLDSLDIDFSDTDKRVDYEVAREQHNHRVRDLIPKIYIHPFVVAAWSTYESGAREMADKFANLLSAEWVLTDIDGNHFCDRLRTFLVQVDIDPGYSRKIQTELHRLIEFRNAIAHENARLSGLDEFREEVKDPNINYVNYSHTGDYFALTVEFAKDAFDVVEYHLEYLMEKYRARKEGKI